MRRSFPAIVCLFIFQSAVAGSIEQSAHLIIQAFSGNQPAVHLSPHLLNIALHGHELAPEQIAELKALGFIFDGPLVNRTNITRWEASGLDRYTDSGIFRFHYTTSGTHSVGSEDLNGNSVPDYVDTAAAVFENVYSQQTSTMEYIRPPGDGTAGGSDHYDVYLRNLSSIYYGYVQGENYANGTGDNEHSARTETLALMSYMTMRNDYSHFSSNTPLENLQVTAAHEFFHAIQYGYDAYEKAWMLEATAVWMEEQVYDSINDCYQYLPSWFAAPETSLDAAGTHWYGSYIFFQYIEEHMGGSDPVRRTFEIGVDSPSDGGDFSHTDIDQALAEQGYSFKSALNGMAVANLLLTSDSEAGDYTYSEAEDYPLSAPDIYRTVDFTKGIESTLNSTSLERFAAQYTKLETDDPIKVDLTPESSSSEDLNMHAILQSNTGSITVYSGNSVNIDPTGMTAMTLAVVSQDTVGDNWDYSISITDGIPSVIGEPLLPGEIRIASNYPNPFNTSTTVDISVADNQELAVTVFDISGRQMSRIFTGSVDPGKMTISWNGKTDSGHNAASGIYFIFADGKWSTASEKMILVR